MTRCCEKAKHCDFETAELDQRIIELVIASTIFESFQKELLDKPKGFEIDEILARAANMKPWPLANNACNRSMAKALQSMLCSAPAKHAQTVI